MKNNHLINNVLFLTISEISCLILLDAGSKLNYIYNFLLTF